MEYLRQIEEDLRALCSEVGKKYPEVADSSERALNAVRLIREIYISEIRSKSSTSGTVKFPRSSDIVSPYILICNYSDASSKLILLSLNGILLLLKYDLIPPSDVQNILRVLQIQAMSSKCDNQLKLLQVIVQLATLLCEDFSNRPYLSDQTIASFLSISLTLCDTKQSASVISASLGTARQLVGLLMDHAGINFPCNAGCSIDNDNAWVIQTIVVIVREMTSMAMGQSGTFIKVSCSTSLQSFALDVLRDILSNWRQYFEIVPQLNDYMYDVVLPAIQSILKSLYCEYHNQLIKNGSTTATSFVTRVLDLVQIVLLNYWSLERAEDYELIFMHLFYVLQPVRDAEDRDNTKGKLSKVGIGSAPSTTDETYSFRLKLEEASAAIMSKISLQNAFSNVISRQSSSSANHLSKLATYDQDAYLFLGRSVTAPMSSLLFAQHVPQNGSDSYIAIHIAGCSIETIFLFIWRKFEVLTTCSAGFHILLSLMSNLSVNSSLLITIILENDPSMRDFDNNLKGNPLFSMLSTTGWENVKLTNELHDYVLNSNGLKSFEVVLLCIFSLSFISKSLLKLILLSNEQIKSRTYDSVSHQFYFPKQLEDRLVGVLGDPTNFSTTEQLQSSELIQMIKSNCENLYESSLDACSNITKVMENTEIISLGISIASELGMACGLLGLSKACEIVVSALCNQALPSLGSHHIDSRMPDSSPSRVSVATLSNSVILRYRNIQAFTRLLQFIHVMADAITDWDCIVDCLEQFTSIYFSQNDTTQRKSKIIVQDKLIHHSVLESIMGCIDLFQYYTVYLSDESLVKLMTSFVALSMNNLSLSTSDSMYSGGSAGIYDINELKFGVAIESDYLTKSLKTGGISYSLKCVISVTKINSFRISTIWQMVTSHLRMLASLKNDVHRSFCIIATYDVIFSAVNEMSGRSKPNSCLNFDNISVEMKKAYDNKLDIRDTSLKHYMFDRDLWSHLFPTVEFLFVNGQLREFDAIDIRKRRFSSSKCIVSGLNLTQSDILSCLKSMVQVPFVDVRVNILRGLMHFLRESGNQLHHDVSGGWKVIFELLSSIPLTMSEESFQLDWIKQRRTGLHVFAVEKGNVENTVVQDDLIIGGSTTINLSDKELLDHYQNQWPKEALHDAFNCLKLIVDEYVENIISSGMLFESLMDCLSLFASQLSDMNIGLTAVEMLWKISDIAISNSNTTGVESKAAKKLADYSINTVFDVMLSRLLALSVDSRPEIRHCAINTFFSALSSNSMMLAFLRWKEVFHDVVFPLFAKVGMRSVVAKRSNEQAVAGELKKGVKISMHHSRDSALKQWSETRVLILRGIFRLIKTCYKVLLSEDWFISVWKGTLQLCIDAVSGGYYELEVSLSGVDIFFGILNIITDVSLSEEDYQSFSTSSESKLCQSNTKSILETVQQNRQQLWYETVSSITSLILASFYQLDIIISITNRLMKFYVSRKDFEFRYNQNVAIILNAAVTLSRPLRFVSTLPKSLTDNHPTKSFSIESKMRKSLLELLACITVIDFSTLELYVSTLSEIAFGAFQLEIVVPQQNMSENQGIPDGIISEGRQQQLMELFSVNSVAETSLPVVHFDIVPTDIRHDVVEILVALESGFCSEADYTKNTNLCNVPSNLLASPVILSTILKRFVLDVCEPSIQRRDLSTVSDRSQVDNSTRDVRSYLPYRNSYYKSCHVQGCFDNAESVVWTSFYENLGSSHIAIVAMKKLLFFVGNTNITKNSASNHLGGESPLATFSDTMKLILRISTCMLSPWKTSELMKREQEKTLKLEDSTKQSEDDFRLNLLEVLNLALGNSNISVNMKVEILQTRIWTLVQMLMIFELFSLESLDKVLLDKTIFVLSKTQIDLQTFAEDENAPIPVRKCALLGLLIICRQVSNVVLSKLAEVKKGYQFIESLLNSFHTIADFFITHQPKDNFHLATTIMRSEFSPRNENLRSQLITITHRQLQRSEALIGEFSKELFHPFEENIVESATVQLPDALNNRVYVMGLYYHALEMLCLCDDVSIRTKCAQLLRSVDIDLMMGIINGLTKNNDLLQKQLNHTALELQSVRSASAFPF